MHIAIDACCLGRRKTGNETYIRGLLSGFEILFARGVTGVRLTILTTSAYTGKRADCFEWIDIPLGKFITRNFLTIPSVLQKLSPDLFHGVYWSRFFAQPLPTVLMVHDLSFVSFPQGFRAHEQWVYANLVRACARSAKHVLTVSQFSKQELMRHWRIPADKITVTYDGLDSCYEASGSEPIREEPSYILYVGNLHPRKNIVRLLDAYVKVCRSGTFPHRLRIVGQATWMAGEVFAAVRESEFASRVDFTGYVSYEKLASLYQNAAVCVYPSLYEGFGLPVLEAMACGCPVVCSNTTSVPEVAGDACVLVNPESSIEIAQGIRSILSNPALDADLRERGPRQAAKFTWEACAEATLAAYRSV
jgi:glycosyltransferase involved in cell wall biosynthesis